MFFFKSRGRTLLQLPLSVELHVERNLSLVIIVSVVSDEMFAASSFNLRISDEVDGCDEHG